MCSYNIKRPRCEHRYRSSEDDTNIVPDRCGTRHNKQLSSTCFRLPFCNFTITEKNRIQEALLQYDTCCSQCKLFTLPTNTDNDDNDDDIVYAQNTNNKLFGRSVTELKLPNHISCKNDDISTAATTVATTSDGYDNNSNVQVQTKSLRTNSPQPRYISFDSIFNGNDTSSTEFSMIKVPSHQDMISFQCYCCQTILSESWKYCPTCGIYLNK